MNRKTLLVAILLILAAMSFAVAGCSCGDNDDDDDNATPPDDDAVDDDTDGDADDDDATDDDATDDDDDGDDDDSQECVSDARPIVFAHGFLAAGDTFANQLMRFSQNGHCPRNLHAFDWNTLAFDEDAEQARFAAFIDDVLADSGFEAIDLVGHSAGGGLSYDYLRSADHRAKVAHYVHVASFDYGAAPDGVPTMTIASEDDLILGVRPLDGATNVEIDGKDHMQVATSEETFELMYTFFHDGAAPATAEIQPEDEIVVNGRVLVLGTNTPRYGYEVRVYELDPATGERASLVEATVSDPEGRFGPMPVRAGVPHEFAAWNEGSPEIPVHYYREPFAASNPLVYIRTFPDPGSLPGIILSVIEFSDEEAVFANFTTNQAIVHGRDSLVVDGNEISTEELTPAEKTAIAIFLFDVNFNDESDLQPAAVFDVIAFLAGFDLRIPTTPRRSVAFEFNGRTMMVPTIKSESEGVAIVVFE
ncbi:hypothetical protein K8I61_06830 [bacterium]|nr:hypothetical protein [bacterium]